MTIILILKGGFMKKVLSFVLGFFLVVNFAFAEDDIKVRIRFEEDTPHGKYTDALYFTIDEYNIITQSEIATMKQERVDNWIYDVTHPTPTPKPTLADWKTREAEIKEFQNVLIADLAEVQAEINALEVE
jgi:hypothetical protein